MEDVTAPGRRCTQCKQDLPLTAYYADKRASGGYRANCKSCHCAAVKRRALANPAAIKRAQAAYRAAHREEARERTALYRLAHPEKIEAHNKTWRDLPGNRRRLVEYKRRRRARIAEAEVVGLISPRLLDQKLAHWGRLCWMCGIAPFQEWDHVKPVSKGGPHMLANLRPACVPCNRRKSATWPYPMAVRR